MFIEHGAGFTAQNNDGLTSDVNSINFGLVVTARLRKIARIMPEHGANVNARSKNGSVPFGLASQGRLAEVGRALVRHDASSGGHDKHRAGSKSCGFVFTLDRVVVYVRWVLRG